MTTKEKLLLQVQRLSKQEASWMLSRLEALRGRGAKPAAPSSRRQLRFAGIGNSGQPELAQRADEMPEAEFLLS